jgi:hypothetical protein
MYVGMGKTLPVLGLGAHDPGWKERWGQVNNSAPSGKHYCSCLPLALLMCCLLLLLLPVPVCIRLQALHHERHLQV